MENPENTDGGNTIMITIKELSLELNHRSILNEINISLEKGLHYILGPNGAGKTSLFRCITGLYSSYSGSIKIISEKTDIGYLPQKFTMIPGIKVYDVMNYFAGLKGIKKSYRKSCIKELLHLVNMDNYLEYRSNHLSGGMMRRVGIAIALLGEPDIIILDEPTVGLDPEERIQFIRVINEIAQDKLILTSTHVVEEIKGQCNSIIIMKEGRIGFHGGEAELCHSVSGQVLSLEDGYLWAIKNCF